MPMRYEDPLYGSVEFSGVVERVVTSPALERLQHVHQNGGVFLANPDMDTSRFEHSLGVAALCKRFGASQREVLAALVHDVGHTAFSHVVDHVFDRPDQAFHEDQFDRIVSRYALDDLLRAHGYDPGSVFELARFPLLERDLPDICADRLDYQLRDLYKYGLLDGHAVDELLAGVGVEDGRLVAANCPAAHSLVDVSLLLQRQVFFDASHEVANSILEDIVGTALDRGILTVADLFQTDHEVLETLRAVDEFAVKLDAIGPDMDVIRGGSDPQYVITRKRRTMDPVVADSGKRISELDPVVNRKIEQFHAAVPLERGYSVASLQNGN